MAREPLGELLDEAVAIMRRKGHPAPRGEVEEIAAHVLGKRVGELVADFEPHDRVAAKFRRLVGRRADGAPMGHLTGLAELGGVEVAVGPGVFVPRPHSELVLASGLAAVAEVSAPLVADLCTGSGAIALALAHGRPDATVHAVDFDPLALDFARRNRERRVKLGDTPIVLHEADVTRPGLLEELTGRVDLVVANPPFMPDGAEVPPEFGTHQPRQAIFGGPDGLRVIRHVVAAAERLLRPGGGFVVEHGHVHGESVPELLRASGHFTEVSTHADHDGWPLYSLARRAGG
ncbi:N5-glutamine methyltransferase family protein [Streptomyces abikoensis]|uniref:N5-glutamine methyltransferase family protein n=1 Tax=Streptomyces abikoensis TaxID=97398 RepID=UPI0036B5AF5D